MLRIRLRRTGRKNRPNYRIVVAEHSAPIGGKFVDQLGHFDPRTKEMGINSEALTKWLNVGAKPSNRVAKLLTTAGIAHKSIVITLRKPRPAKNAEEVEAKKPAAAPAPEATEAAAETPAETTQEPVAETAEAPAEPEPAATEETPTE